MTSQESNRKNLAGNQITMKRTELLPGLWCFEDTCNVYVVRNGDSAVAIDFGSGKWMSDLPRLGINRLEHVFLTHHHADQCAGLKGMRSRSFTVHAPRGEDRFLDPKRLGKKSLFSTAGRGCPSSYSVLPGGIGGVWYDMVGFFYMYWGDQRIRFVHTPGHGPDACSIVLDHAGKQVVFCGDAFHSGATLWQPFNLEWDHWTGGGTLAAWEGVMRLAGMGVDLLCPSHGPAVTGNPRGELKKLASRLMKFYVAKGNISPGENDKYMVPEIMPCGAKRLLPHLYNIQHNAYLLVSDSGAGLLVDVVESQIPILDALCRELGGVKPEVMLVSHYHCDHSEGIPWLKKHRGVKSCLHERVAEPLDHSLDRVVPFLPPRPIEPDIVLKGNAVWKWREYTFKAGAWPGQTWWHGTYMTDVDGRKVVFSGDSFQPSSRWNGTGGFCAYNNSRFGNGFVKSCDLILKWKPDFVVAGHGTHFKFKASKFRKIQKWALNTEQVVRDLCPSANLEKDYYNIPSCRPGNPEKGVLFWG